MSFDPTLPAPQSPIVSAELRSQFNGLKDLIDAKIPAAEVGIANGVASLDTDGVLEQPADFNTLANKPAPVADGTYTVGLGTATNGTITVVKGIITAVQEATNGGYALQFDGTQNYASTPDTAGWNVGQLTVEFWLKTTLTDNRGMAAVSTAQYAPNGEGWMIGWGGAGGAVYYGYVDSNGTGYGNAGGSVSATPVNDGNWHHIAVTFDNANLVGSLYIDGVLDGTLPFSSPLVLSGTAVPLYVASSYNPVYVAPVTMDEVRVSRVVRYSSDFTPAASFTADSDTLGYWKFNEGHGSTAHDETGNNDLTLSGTPAPTWTDGK